MTLFASIDHAAVACRDVRGLAAWYCQNLGMTILADDGRDPPSMVVGFGVLGRGATGVELMPARDAGPNPADVPRLVPGLRHLAIGVTDFDAALAGLKSAGVKLMFEPVPALGGGRVVSFRDPEGNELQIVQRIAVSPK